MSDKRNQIRYADAVGALKAVLIQHYDVNEASAIARIAGEETFGRDAARSNSLLEMEQLRSWDIITAKLSSGMPLQYALGRAWFMDMTLEVNPSVLIPRPETEELVEHAINLLKAEKLGNGCRLLDIGTGSGCIAIAMKRALQAWEVHAIDISDAAIEIATRNAKRMHADVHYANANILEPVTLSGLGMFDVIISNPPYIAPAEATGMHKNVVDHEPHPALFTGDDDPLEFYRAIAAFGRKALHKGGYIFCEISALRGEETKNIFTSAGYNEVQLITDMQGLPRIVTARHAG